MCQAKLLFLLISFALMIYSNSKLIFTLCLIRHGARGPTEDLYNPLKLPPGELTEVGMRQHYILGRELRNRYVGSLQLLSEKFNTSEIFARSTDYPRTIISAQSFLSGLYPIPYGPNISDSYPMERAVPPYPFTFNFSTLNTSALPLNFQPLPLHILTTNEDSILHTTSVCQKKVDEYNKIQKETPFYKQICQEFTPLVNTMLKVFNISSTSGRDPVDFLSGLFDDVFCSDFQNVSRPSGFTPDMVKPINYIYSYFMYYFWLGHEEEIKLLNTPAFSEILSFMDQALQKTPKTPKFVLYSGHETNIVLFNMFLNLSNWRCQADIYRNGTTSAKNCVDYPSFASSLNIELYDDGGEPYVQILYNGEWVYLCDSNSIKCAYKEFKSRILKQLAPDFEKLCHSANLFSQFLNT